MAGRIEVTDGCKKLRAVLKTITQAEVGKRVGKDQRTVSRWALALGRPDGVTTLRLQVAFNIDPMSWLTKRERRAHGAAA